MKKLISIIIAMILSFTMFVPVFATSMEKTGDMGQKSIIGKYQYSAEQNVYMSDLCDGSYSIFTDEGLKIGVTPKYDNNLTLVIRVIQNADNAFTWFERCFSGYNGRIIPLDIFYIDRFGERFEIKGDEKITISFSNNISNVYFLSIDEKIEEVKSQIESDTISFETLKNRGYYILFIKENNQQGDFNEASNNAGTSNDTPKTGDMNIKYISFFGLVFFAILSFIAIYMYIKNMKNDKKSECEE